MLDSILGLRDPTVAECGQWDGSCQTDAGARSQSDLAVVVDAQNEVGRSTPKEIELNFRLRSVIADADRLQNYASVPEHYSRCCDGCGGNLRVLPFPAVTRT